MQAALARLISGIPTGVGSSAFHFTGLGCSGGSGTPLGWLFLLLLIFLLMIMTRSLWPTIGYAVPFSCSLWIMGSFCI